MIFTKTYRVCLIFFLSLFLQACTEQDTAKEINDFFFQAKFKGNFFKFFDIRNPDTTVAYIRENIPTKWWGIACEGAYYNLTSQYAGTSDSAQLLLLDKLEQHFPSDSFHVFKQMIKAEIFIKSLHYDSAFLYLTDAYNLSMESKHYLRAADIQCVFAQLALRQNDYPEATKTLLAYHNRVILLGEEEDRGRVFQSFKLLGMVYKRSFNFKESHEWYLKAWKFAMSDSNNRRRYYSEESAHLLAESYLRLKMADSAQIMLDTAQHFYLIYKNLNDKALNSIIQAQIYIQQGKCQKALPLLYLAKQENKTANDLEKVSFYNKAIGDGYLCGGNLDSAIHYYTLSLKSPDTLQQIVIWEELANIYAQRKDFKAAYLATENSKELSERVLTQDKEQAIGRLQLKNEMEKRELQLITKESTYKINRLILLTIVFGLSFLLVLGIFWVFRKRKTWQLSQQSQQLLQQEKELLLQEKELSEIKEIVYQQKLKLVQQNLSNKEAELVQSTQLLDARNRLIQELEMKLTSRNEADESEEKLSKLKILTAEDWRKFRLLFDQLFPNFSTSLALNYPNLTSSETRLLLLLKLDFDAGEIANILGISLDSVYKSRYRLRKKLNLEEGIELLYFIQHQM